MVDDESLTAIICIMYRCMEKSLTDSVSVLFWSKQIDTQSQTTGNPRSAESQLCQTIHGLMQKLAENHLIPLQFSIKNQAMNHSCIEMLTHSIKNKLRRNDVWIVEGKITLVE